MPSKSPQQHRFMEAIAHNKAFAKKVGVPQSVGEDFSNADKGKKFKQGGAMKNDKQHEMMQAKQLRKLAKEEESEAKGMSHGGMGMKKMAGGGAMNPKLAALIAAAGRGGAPGRPMARPMAPPGRPMQPPMGGPTDAAGGMPPGMKRGGSIEKMGPRSMSEDVESGSNKNAKFGESKLQKRGHTKGKEPKMFAAGGSVGASAHRRADGIAERGHTKTKMFGNGGKMSKSGC